jgi:extradiol dioxygenase family protein
MTQLAAFHLAIPVSDLEQTKDFYIETLGCSTGRTSEKWVDLNFFGHQLVLHLVEKETPATKNNAGHNPVDGHEVPVPHFGVVLEWNDWHAFAEKLRSKKISFTIEPYIRFAGQIGEQATMFFYDPSGNALEFKAFKDITQLFAAR